MSKQNALFNPEELEQINLAIEHSHNVAIEVMNDHAGDWDNILLIATEQLAVCELRNCPDLQSQSKAHLRILSEVLDQYITDNTECWSEPPTDVKILVAIVVYGKILGILCAS